MIEKEFIIAYRNSKKVSKYRVLVYEIVKFLNEILLVEFHFHSMFVFPFHQFLHYFVVPFNSKKFFEHFQYSLIIYKWKILKN